MHKMSGCAGAYFAANDVPAAAPRNFKHLVCQTVLCSGDARADCGAAPFKNLLNAARISKKVAAHIVVMR
jgi:hypothetical protein